MINCPFCQGPLTSVEEPEILPEYDHYFHDHTCESCQTKDCNLRFNICIRNGDVFVIPELINYWLKCKGYTAVIGVKWPGTEITEDWHTKEVGSGYQTTMCHPIYKSEQSLHITPSNFLEKLKLVKVFQ